MTIVARYPGKCNKCGRSIQVGDQINWVKGEGSEHVTCPAAKASATVTAPAPKPQTSAPQLEVERLAARYAGTCAGCGDAIKQGEEIEYHRSQRAAYHLRCAHVATEPAPLAASFSNRYKDDLPTAGYVFRSNRYNGKLLTIVRATTRRVSQSEVDDQDDFRHGGDAFYELTAYCREATESEAAPVIAREQAAAAKAAARERLEQIAREIRKAENHVTNPNEFAATEGVERIDVQLSTITALRVRPTGIWLHESTYDDSHSWRIDYDATLAAEIRRLAPILDKSGNQ